MPVSFDRRQFLKASSGLLLGLGLAQIPVRGDANPGRLPTAVPSDRWRELAGSLQGTLLRLGDPDFARIARPWNLRFASILPDGIARCVSAADVRSCLLWGQANTVPVVARSGGHSYTGYSTTTGLMIDLSLMNQVRYDAGTGLARLGGGATNGDIYASLRRVGRAVTHGRCEAVGASGLVLGGGIGFNQRLHGLFCDQLVAAEVMTAAGDLLACSEADHAGLFWACRGGGGGNFGIATSLTFQTFPVDMVTAYEIIWTENLDAVLPALLDLLPNTTERLGCKLSVINDGSGLSIELLGQLVGTAAELRSLLAAVYRLATPSQETVQTLPYWDAQDFLSEPGDPDYSHERSRYVYQPIPEDGSRTILDLLRRWPGTHASTNWKMFLAGDAIAAVAADATAFVHRGAQMISSIELDWTPDDSIGSVQRNETWLAEFHEAVKRFTSEESYQNFLDEAQTDFLHAYYGANLDRLMQIKRQYDPQNIFRSPQSIPLSS